MADTKTLEDFLLELKGNVFFISPRERLFLKALLEAGVPEQVIKEGLRECYLKVNPRRTGKYPAFLCYREVYKRYEEYLRALPKKLEWKERFRRKLTLAGISEKDVPLPKSEREAYEILKRLEDEMIRDVWRKLDGKEKREILKKFGDFRRDRELFREMVKIELKKRFNLPELNLYLD